jgi:hypothetical protein
MDCLEMEDANDCREEDRRDGVVDRGGRSLAVVVASEVLRRAGVIRPVVVAEDDGVTDRASPYASGMGGTCGGSSCREGGLAERRGVLGPSERRGVGVGIPGAGVERGIRGVDADREGCFVGERDRRGVLVVDVGAGIRSETLRGGFRTARTLATGRNKPHWGGQAKYWVLPVGLLAFVVAEMVRGGAPLHSPLHAAVVLSAPCKLVVEFDAGPRTRLALDAAEEPERARHGFACREFEFNRRADARFRGGRRC